VTGVFGGLFDDAALFPPGDAPMADAVPAHRLLRADFGELVGPFIVPATRLDELTSCLDDGGPFGISLIAAPCALPAAAARVAADRRLELCAVEVPLVADAAATRTAVQVLDGVLSEGVAGAIEVPWTLSRGAVLDVLTGTGYRAKLRTGGVTREHFPDEAELAAALADCQHRGLALKCTAGLHHALRHTAADTGFEHHGFLNVLLAADTLAQGAPPSAAAELLKQRNGAIAADQLRTWSPARVDRARKLFTSSGTCSVLDPIDDLLALGLLTTSERTRA